MFNSSKSFFLGAAVLAMPLYAIDLDVVNSNFEYAANAVIQDRIDRGNDSIKSLSLKLSSENGVENDVTITAEANLGATVWSEAPSTISSRLGLSLTDTSVTAGGTLEAKTETVPLVRYALAQFFDLTDEQVASLRNADGNEARVQAVENLVEELLEGGETEAEIEAMRSLLTLYILDDFSDFVKKLYEVNQLAAVLIEESDDMGFGFFGVILKFVADFLKSTTYGDDFVQAALVGYLIFDGEINIEKFSINITEGELKFELSFSAEDVDDFVDREFFEQEVLKYLEEIEQSTPGSAGYSELYVIVEEWASFFDIFVGRR